MEFSYDGNYRLPVAFYVETVYPDSITVDTAPAQVEMPAHHVSTHFGDVYLVAVLGR